MERITHDHYPTPTWCIELALKHIRLPAGRWLEPAAGHGQIVQAVNAVRNDIVWAAWDIRPETFYDLYFAVGDRAQVGDALELFKTCDDYDVVMTNPPYVLAHQFVMASLGVAEHVLMLLRLSFLASARRQEFIDSTRPDVWVLPQRPKFRSDTAGTDVHDYAWFHWHPGSLGTVRVLPVVPLAARRF